MKFDINEIKASLEEYKGAFLDKLKTSESATSDKIEQVGKDLDAKIKDQIKLLTERKLSLPGLEEELKKKTFHISKAVIAQVCEGGWNAKEIGDASFEREVLEQTAKLRSSNAQSGEAGGVLIPEEVSGDVIELAMASTPVLEFGPTVLRGLRGELPIPKITGRPQMYWVGEEEEATETSPTYGEIVLRPKTAAAFSKVSRRLLFQSAGTAEQILRQELVKAFALGLDKTFVSGLGTDKEPKGIINYSGLTATTAMGANGGRFTVDKAAEMQMNLDVANMLKGNLGYLMRPEVLSFLLRERVDMYSAQPAGEGMPINPAMVLMSQKQIEDVLGYKVRTSTLISKYTKGTSDSASRVLFGDWSQLTIGMWEGFEIKASDVAGNATGSAMTQRQIWITAFQGVDVNVKDETGFTVLADALCDATEF